MKKVLFVAYGSGHIKMVVPLALALNASGLGHAQVLALTTAAPVARSAGLEVLQFRDFVEPGDAAALAMGQRLMADMSGPIADPIETAAYLGLSMADLIEEQGAEAAEGAYRQHGRQAFLPIRTLQRILKVVQPDLLVATNSPRAERAAVLAACSLGIPALCVVDLFAIDEVKWIGAPDYADRVCVLNESVREFLIGAGRRADQVVVTGNPGFDGLNTPEVRRLGLELRENQGWLAKKVILWPNQTEPAFHPFDGRPSDPTLPASALATVVAWVQQRHDVVLCVRARAGEAQPQLPDDPRFVLTGQDWPLAPLLHATDLVVTLNSTVGLEGHLAGCRLVQVLGSVFDQAMPLERYEIADVAVELADLPGALNRWIEAPRRTASEMKPATERVLAEMAAFL